MTCYRVTGYEPLSLLDRDTYLLTKAAAYSSVAFILATGQDQRVVSKTHSDENEAVR